MQNRSILDPTIKIRVVKYFTIVQVASSKFPLFNCVLDRDRERERGGEREREREREREKEREREREGERERERERERGWRIERE